MSFTEAAIAVGLAALVLGAAFAFVPWCTRAVGRASSFGDARQTAHLALAAVRGTLMDAQSFEVQEDGARLAYTTPAGSGAIYCQNKRLMHAPPRGRAAPLVAGSIRDFAATTGWPGSVRVCVLVEQAGKADPFPSVDDIALACARPRQTILPWRP